MYEDKSKTTLGKLIAYLTKKGKYIYTLWLETVDWAEEKVNNFLNK